MARPTLKLNKAAENQHAEYVEDLQTALKSAARGIAMMRGASVVDQQHVEDAYDILKRQGLSEKRKIEPGEIAYIVGSGLISLTLGVPDFVPLLTEDKALAPNLSISICVALSICGVASYFVGYFLCRRR